MIIDSITNLDKYLSLHPAFAEAIEYIRAVNFTNPSLKKTEIDGLNLFANVSESELRSKDVAKLEVHNQYIDIQFPVSKEETFGWSPRELLKDEDGAFDPSKDIQYYKDTVSTYFTIKPGNFVIFFPQDGHAPCIGEDNIVKGVVKVKIR